MQEIRLGFSPCPNDTFIFHALVHGSIALPGVRLSTRLEDVETLNALAFRGELDVAKVSYGALPALVDRYVLLRSGGALGRGCGPLLVARQPLAAVALQHARIAVPGRRTTANRLLRFRFPSAPEGIELRYDEIMPAVARGEVDAGLIIHESRFTYQNHGLTRIADLGDWWETETGLPIPLGGIVARRELGAGRIIEIQRAIRASVEHAFADPDASLEYRRSNAVEMDDAVMREHVALYVNEFSADLGAEGVRAVEAFLERAGSETTDFLAPAA
jgi:1,4-dihydroxy-6-naphthoate synthase